MLISNKRREREALSGKEASLTVNNYVWDIKPQDEMSLVLIKILKKDVVLVSF